MPAGPAPTPPAIAAVPAGTPRPRWSVMIPTWNCAGYLAETLASVLAQDPGPAAMQIEVVDDASGDDPAAVVARLGGGRVAFHRHPVNGGAIANFNACIARSRGELVHILHGDDLVEPGFYAAMHALAQAQPDAGLLFCRAFTVEADGALLELSPRFREWEAGFRGMPERLWYVNEIRTPAVVVRRAAYERHGGYLPHLVHTADWEMWERLAGDASAAALNRALARYRDFAASHTGRLMRTGGNLEDCLRCGEVFAARRAGFDLARFRRLLARRALDQAAQFRAHGDAEAAAANDAWWRRLAAPRQRLAHFARRLLGTAA